MASWLANLLVERVFVKSLTMSYEGQPHYPYSNPKIKNLMRLKKELNKCLNQLKNMVQNSLQFGMRSVSD